MVDRMPRVAAVVKFNSLLVQENVDFHLMDVGASREAAGLRDQVVIELNHRYRPDLIIGSTLKARSAIIGNFPKTNALGLYLQEV